MSTASPTLTQPTPQQLSHAVTEIGRLTLQGSSEVYSLGQLALAWLERPEGYRIWRWWPMRCRPFAGPRSGWRSWWRTR